MHQNKRFNILQHGFGFKIKFVVIDGQRTDSGGMAKGAKVVSKPMTREQAIELADKMQADSE